MIKEFLLDLLFSKFCFSYQREGSYLCQDCQSIIGVLRSHQNYSRGNLSDLYWATPYQSSLVRNLIHSFKYEPFIKELAKPLSLLIINHFQLIEKQPDFSDFILIPVPLHQKRLKWRGFNQAKELGNQLSKFLNLPLYSDCLVKTKTTIPQMELPKKKRKENVLGAFLVQNKQNVKRKKVLLIDDIFTTGATMEEAARVLREAGVREVIGVVVARG